MLESIVRSKEVSVDNVIIPKRANTVSLENSRRNQEDGDVGRANQKKCADAAILSRLSREKLAFDRERVMGMKPAEIVPKSSLPAKKKPDF